MDEREAEICYDSLSEKAKGLLSLVASQKNVECTSRAMEERYLAASLELLGAELIKGRVLDIAEEDHAPHRLDYALTIHGLMVVLTAEHPEFTLNALVARSMVDRIANIAEVIDQGACMVLNNYDDHVNHAYVEKEIGTIGWYDYCRFTMKREEADEDELVELEICLKLIDSHEAPCFPEHEGATCDNDLFDDSFMLVCDEFDRPIPLSKQDVRLHGYGALPQRKREGLYPDSHAEGHEGVGPKGTSRYSPDDGCEEPASLIKDAFLSSICVWDSYAQFVVGAHLKHRPSRKYYCGNRRLRRHRRVPGGQRGGGHAKRVLRGVLERRAMEW